MAYVKKQVFTSPKGVFRYPSLDKPDFGNTAFPKPNGEYKVQLVVTPDVAEIMLAKLAPLFDAAVEEGQKLFDKLPIASRKKLGEMTINDLVSVIYDKETEEPTGEVFFKFSTAASGVNAKKEKWNRKIALFDAKGKPLAKAPSIWGGTVGKVSFEAAAYFVPGTGTAGLKLYLTAAQIIELKSGGGRDANEYGFGEEDGYDGSAAAAEGEFGDESGVDNMPPADDGSQDF